MKKNKSGKCFFLCCYFGMFIFLVWAAVVSGYWYIGFFSIPFAVPLIIIEKCIDKILEEKKED